MGGYQVILGYLVRTLVMFTHIGNLSNFYNNPLHLTSDQLLFPHLHYQVNEWRREDCMQRRIHILDCICAFIKEIPKT